LAIAGQMMTPTAHGEYRVQAVQEVVADKGYHSGPVLAEVSECVRTYNLGSKTKTAEMGKAKRSNKQQSMQTNGAYKVSAARFYASVAVELLERPFAHQYETGAMRRLHVRGLDNVAKRVLLQAAAFNLALILRSITKAGTPRGLADLKQKLGVAFWRVLATLQELNHPNDRSSPVSTSQLGRRFVRFAKLPRCQTRGSDTGC